MIFVNKRAVDIQSIVVDNVNMNDYPDFSDAYASEAYFFDGSELTESELETLQDSHGDLIHELAHETI